MLLALRWYFSLYLSWWLRTVEIKQNKKKTNRAVNFVLTRQHSSYYYIIEIAQNEKERHGTERRQPQYLCAREMKRREKMKHRRRRRKKRKEKEEAEKLLSEYNARNV